MKKSMIDNNHVEVTHLRDKLDSARANYFNIMNIENEMNALRKQLRARRSEAKKEFIRLGRILKK